RKARVCVAWVFGTCRRRNRSKWRTSLDWSEVTGGYARVRAILTVKVLLKKGKARPFFARHPWVFAGAVGRVEGAPAAGDEVELCTDDGAFVARGLWNEHSQIRVRLYAFAEAERLDDEFFRRRIDAA